MLISGCVEYHVLIYENCKIVYNHYRKTAKIGNGWRTFAQTQNLLLGTQIIFEFPDATSNFVLLWLCL